MKPARIGLLVTIFGAAFCLSCLYLAMRGLMRLGGQVSSGVVRGGAPGWVWVVPVSIILGLAMIFASIFMNQRAEGVNIAMPAWSALFLSLGWNFLDFGFNPRGRVQGPGTIGAFVACGVVFVIMGAVPVGLMLKNRKSILKGVNESLLIFQLAAVGLGVFAAVKFISALS